MDDGSADGEGETELLHAHAIGAECVALMSLPIIEAGTSPYGQADIPAIADRLPDKIPSVHFRPPIV